MKFEIGMKVRTKRNFGRIAQTEGIVREVCDEGPPEVLVYIPERNVHVTAKPRELEII